MFEKIKTKLEEIDQEKLRRITIVVGVTIGVVAGVALVAVVTNLSVDSESFVEIVEDVAETTQEIPF